MGTGGARDNPGSSEAVEEGQDGIGGGVTPGLVAAAGLLIDYILTVAVSIASGVAAITSAFGSLQPDTVWIGVGVIIVLLAGNMRGVRQAATGFAVPTYAFIAAMAILIIAGLVHAAGRGFHPVPVRHVAVVQALSVLLVLRAFASGSTAMTGIEAISNALSGIVFVVAGVTKFTSGAWVSNRPHRRDRRHLPAYSPVLRHGRATTGPAPGEATTSAALSAPFAPRADPGTAATPSSEGGGAPDPEARAAETPAQVHALTVVPVMALDRASIRTLAYAAALGQPAFALHLSPTSDLNQRIERRHAADGP